MFTILMTRRGGFCYFFFQAEDGIRDGRVTGVQTCALPICAAADRSPGAAGVLVDRAAGTPDDGGDRKSTRLNSSHPSISYAVFCLKKKTETSNVDPPTGQPRGRPRLPQPSPCRPYMGPATP